MKNRCIRIPRLLVPRGEYEAQWASPCAHENSDRALWQRSEREGEKAPSALRFLLPELSSEDEDAHIAAICESMYDCLTDGVLEKLNRGGMLIEETKGEQVKRGIVATIDLECYSSVYGERAPVRPIERPAQELSLVALRSAALLEVTQTTILYRDKRGRLLSGLLQSELEEVYSISLPEGERRTGYFLPAGLARSVAEAMHTRGDPCFAVAEGGEYIEAAKVRWEALKRTLGAERAAHHPARYLLAEFVDLYDEDVRLYPVHRLVTGVDREDFAAHFLRSVKAVREGDVLRLQLHAGPAAIEACDAAIRTYVGERGGNVAYVQGEAALKRRAAEENGLGIVTKAPEKEKLFGYLKKGRFLPAHAVSILKTGAHRHYFECREISYD